MLMSLSWVSIQGYRMKFIKLGSTLQKFSKQV